MEKTKRPSYKYCLVPKCKNTTIATPNKLFFRLPTNPNIQNKWCKAMRRDTVSPLSRLYCCEDHFNIENDMENYIKYKLVGGMIKLKKGVVPHKFKCQQDNNDKPERTTVKKRVNFHIFPNQVSRPDRFEAWVKAIGGTLDTPEDFEFYKRQRICDRHFSDDSKTWNNRVAADRVPTLHLKGTDEHILHKFPNPNTDLARFKAWVNAIGGALLFVDIKTIYRNYRVCKSHFEPIFHSCSGRVTRNAVPTLLLSGKVHHFPPPIYPYSEKFDQWKEVLSETDKEKGDKYIRNNIRICDHHFEHFYLTGSGHLTKNAVPTLNIDRFQKQLSNEKPPPETETTNPVVDETSTLEDATIDTVFEEDTSVNIIIQDTETSNENRKDSTVEFVEELEDVYMSDTCDERNNETPDAESLHIEQPVPTANDNTSYWKRQLSYILHNTQFCGICLCTEDKMNTVNDTLEIIVGGRSHSKTVLEVIDVVFKENDDILSNSQICNSCTKNLIQSYMFIQRAKETSRMLHCHLNDIYNKSCYIRNNILNNEKQPENVLITLENYDASHHMYNPVNIAQEAKKSEVISNKETEETEKQKPKYKCSICNLFLPSYNTWRLHEKSAHRDKKHKEDPSRLRHVRKICKLCRRVIQIGGLAEHMTKYHKHAMTRSPRNITIVSGGDLNTHITEKRGSKDSKCLTCLKSYKEEEVEQQPCRFCCAECSKASCLHYKYLSWHKDQISKGVLRAKCLHCEYVCKSEEALLKHVNMWHVKHLSKIAIKSESSN